MDVDPLAEELVFNVELDIFTWLVVGFSDNLDDMADIIRWEANSIGAFGDDKPTLEQEMGVLEQNKVLDLIAVRGYLFDND